ncbi:MAG TPA: TlpA disulfide reductase family protein [Thermomicrobiales bacterium]|nr:TlpA disulfide reductase family protein [Thermomicrobiales bacterium]
MIDDTMPQESSFQDESIAPSEDAPASDELPQGSVIRTRVIPAIAGLMLLAVIGLILWSMFAPESARQQSNRRVGNAIVLREPEQVENFQLEPLDGGEPVALSDFRGKTVVINFWASWCQPCLREIPILMQAVREFDEDTVMLGINTLDDLDEARAMEEEFGMNYLSLNDNGRGDGGVAVEFGLIGVPETFIINADGELVAFQRGDFTSTTELHELIALAK